MLVILKTLNIINEIKFESSEFYKNQSQNYI